MISLPLQPYSVNIPGLTSGSAVTMSLNQWHVNSDGSGQLDFQLLNSGGVVLYSGSLPTTAAGITAAGCNLSTLSAALQTVSLSTIGATHG